jgi:hypothetical protein
MELYSHPKTTTGNESWTPIWSVPDNICEDIPIDSVRDGHTLESMVEQTPQNNNEKQEISTQYLRGSAICLHPRD